MAVFENSTRPPATTRFKVGVAVTAVAVVLGVGYVMKRSVDREGAHPLSEAERLGLVERTTTEGTFLVHPDLGFRLRHPGALFFASDEAEAKLARQFDDDSTRYYAYAEMKTGDMLYVTVSKRPGLDTEGYEHMVDTVAHVFAQQTMARLGDEIPVDTVDRTFDHAKGRAAVHQVLAEGRAHLRVAAWKTTFGRGVDYVVVLTAVTMSRDAMGGIIDSFSLR